MARAPNKTQTAEAVAARPGQPRPLQRLHGQRAASPATVRALDEEPMDQESRVSKPVELRSWIGHGHHHRPNQIRKPP
eukprot:9245349-Pyramimonas_sp.AAC.1